ncbi:MAG: VOC family protein [Gemmatimonadota bacterium]|jgi:predicted enzyme related to lactoylglutathione lyase|nr:VOC family protein [Gemmatimonadota bacterium]
MSPSPRVGSIFFYISDIDQTERFYRDLIGLEIMRIPDDGSGRPWLHAPIPGNTELLFFQGEVRTGNSPVLVFELPEGGIDGVVSGLVEAGATIVTPVSHAPGGWSFDFADPDGYVLSYYQPDSQPR